MVILCTRTQENNRKQILVNTAPHELRTFGDKHDSLPATVTAHRYVYDGPGCRTMPTCPPSLELRKTIWLFVSLITAEGQPCFLAGASSPSRENMPLWIIEIRCAEMGDPGYMRRRFGLSCCFVRLQTSYADVAAGRETCLSIGGDQSQSLPPAGAYWSLGARLVERRSTCKAAKSSNWCLFTRAVPKRLP